MIATFKTNGKGVWTKVAKEVTILFMEKIDCELRVYFDIASWNNKKYDFIYTDPMFLSCLKTYLKKDGKKYAEAVDYSEQGMQGLDYVSFDIP